MNLASRLCTHAGPGQTLIGQGFGRPVVAHKVRRLRDGGPQYPTSRSKEGAMQQYRRLRIPDTPADVCDPERIALVVYDMQVGVVRQLADGAQVTSRVRRVLDAARRAGVRTYFTRHMTLPTELMGISQLRSAMAWQRRDRVEDVVSPFLRDSPGFQIVPELEPLASEAVFDKLSMSAFEGTPLAFALRDSQVTAFVIAGVATEVGLEPTVRHGADRGLIPIVVTDACGAGDASAAQRSLDALAFSGDAILTDIDTITGLLARPETG
jgi:nicotinamidase-related amidase